jgi:hypothetical protein
VSEEIRGNHPVAESIIGRPMLAPSAKNSCHYHCELPEAMKASAPPRIIKTAPQLMIVKKMKKIT